MNFNVEVKNEMLSMKNQEIILVWQFPRPWTSNEWSNFPIILHKFPIGYPIENMDGL